MSTAPRDPAVRRSWGEDDSGTPILHVDMDSFFAAVEVVEDPALAGQPVIVGGTGMRGVVTSATYDVRAYGVRAGMPMQRARSLAPKAVVLPGRRHLYREYSRRVMNILASVSAQFEPISIDEAFLDVSGARLRLGSPLQVAAEIRSRIREEAGLPASVGIGNSKTVAKIASSHAKPDGVLLVPAHRTVEFLHSLPVGALPGVGKKTRERLETRGITTVAELSQTTRPALAAIVGEAHAHALLLLCAGEDTRPVGNPAPEKSISTEKTFSNNLVRREDLERYLLHAAHECAARLRKAGLVAWTVQIKLRSAGFQTITRAQTLSTPTDLGREVAAVALEILSSVTLPRGGIRLAGVGVYDLRSRQDGVPLPFDHDPRPLAAERVMDRAAEKFGGQVLKPATLLARERGPGEHREQGGNEP